MKIPCYIGTAHWPGGSFRPDGKLRHTGAHHNPVQWRGKSVVSARVLVGFKVGNRVRWKVGDLESLVERVREKQTGNPNSSFISQRGIYRSTKNREVIHEPGAQVIIIDEDGAGIEAFTDQMVELAEVIASDFQQESVIVEIQKSGIVQETMGVSA